MIGEEEAAVGAGHDDLGGGIVDRGPWHEAVHRHTRAGAVVFGNLVGAVGEEVGFGDARATEVSPQHANSCHARNNEQVKSIVRLKKAFDFLPLRDNFRITLREVICKESFAQLRM